MYTYIHTYIYITFENGLIILIPQRAEQFKPNGQGLQSTLWRETINSPASTSKTVTSINMILLTERNV